MNPCDHAVERARADLVARLDSRREELEAAILARIREDLLGSPGHEDAEYLMGLRAAVTEAVGHGLRGIQEGEEWSPSVPAEVLAQARRAARIGVSLDTVLRRYVAGHTLLEDYVMQEADRDFSGHGNALRRVLRAQASLLDGLLGAIVSEVPR